MIRRIVAASIPILVVAACGGGSSFGQACSGDAECGSGNFCNPQGVCTRYCQNPEDCGCGASQTGKECGYACVEAPGATQPTCVKTCTAPNECAGQTTCQDPCTTGTPPQCLGYTVCI
jgi:hypothetical protein